LKDTSTGTALSVRSCIFWALLSVISLFDGASITLSDGPSRAALSA